MKASSQEIQRGKVTLAVVCIAAIRGLPLMKAVCQIILQAMVLGSTQLGAYPWYHLTAA